MSERLSTEAMKGPHGGADVSRIAVYPTGASISDRFGVMAFNGKIWSWEPANGIGRLLHVQRWALAENMLNDLRGRWDRVAGDPSPDPFRSGFTISGALVRDRLNGKEVVYYDVGAWDVNLGALMQQYEDHGWSGWFWWVPNAELARSLAAEVGGPGKQYADRGEIENRARAAWEDLADG